MKFLRKFRLRIFNAFLLATQKLSTNQGDKSLASHKIYNKIFIVLGSRPYATWKFMRKFMLGQFFKHFDKLKTLCGQFMHFSALLDQPSPDFL